MCNDTGEFRWWPIIITTIILVMAIGHRILGWIISLIRKRKQYRDAQSSDQDHIFSTINGAAIDVEQGNQMSSKADPGFEEEDETSESEGESQGKIRQWDTTNSTPVCSAPLTHDHRQSSRFVRLSSIRNNIRPDQWKQNGLTTGQQILPQTLYTKDKTKQYCTSRFSETIKSWLRRNQIGLSSQYQLTLKLHCERYTTLSYSSGIIMFTVYTVLCTISWLSYIIETADRSPISITGICYSSKMRVIAWMNFVINLFCLGYYVLRLCAATDGVRFILSYPPVIDILVIPSALCAPFESRRFLDANFLRATCIFNYVDVLAYLGFIKSNRSIQTVRICFALFTMWMVGSGLMHVIEHLGDFWDEDSPKGTWSYFEASYFLLVTLSTVGYGDYVTRTTLGKLFICIFIPVAMAVSASFIPELFRNFNRNGITSDRYEYINGEKHVLVCGNFDNGSLRAFIKGFLYGGRTKGRVRLNLVILRPIPIDLALKAILTHFHAWVRYFIGTPNNPRDLARARLSDARAAIILATPNSKNPDAEDGANIMQAITLKARKKTLRVVLQLHSFRNKCLINNFPRWTYLADDMIICMEELKLGLMAYNCLAPGFATLILNLLNTHGSQKQTFKHFEKWREEYEYGFQMDLHDVGLSPEFDNLHLRDVLTFVYEKWNIILLAVRCFDPIKMVIVPSDLNFVLKSTTMRVIVIAKDYSQALRIQYYCTLCMAHVTDQPCICRERRNTRGQQLKATADVTLLEEIGKMRHAEVMYNPSEIRSRPLHSNARTKCQSLSNIREVRSAHKKDIFFTTHSNDFDPPGRGHTQTSANTTYPMLLSVPPRLDRTQSFHWVPDVPLENAILTPNQAAEYKFTQHVLVCAVGNPSAGPLNLENFMMPLRFHWQSVRDVVILGNSNLIGQNEWTKLKNMSRIYVVDGDPCSFTDLHAVRLGFCHACVILGDTGDELNTESVDICLQDRKTLLCAMNIRSLLNRELQVVHLTTELRYEKNAHLFSSMDTQQHDYKLPVWLNEPFARGLIFSNSLLYSCLSSLFYNADVFRFLRVLISGQSADEIEASFAVGTGLQPFLKTTTGGGMPGVNVTLIGFDQLPFSLMAKEKRRKPLMFAELFLRCITCWRILCLGIYRLESRGFRYVLANPRPDTILFTQDMFYCLTPIDQENIGDNWCISSPVESPR